MFMPLSLSIQYIKRVYSRSGERWRVDQPYHDSFLWILSVILIHFDYLNPYSVEQRCIFHDNLVSLGILLSKSFIYMRELRDRSYTFVSRGKHGKLMRISVQARGSRPSILQVMVRDGECIFVEGQGFWLVDAYRDSLFCVYSRSVSLLHSSRVLVDTNSSDYCHGSSRSYHHHCKSLSRTFINIISPYSVV